MYGGGSGSSGTNGSVSITWTSPVAPTVSAIAPASAINTGAASLASITGTGFASGATVKLTKAGQSDIACTGVSFTSATTLSGGSCPISGAAAGSWNVVVTNADAQSGTLANGFYVSTPGTNTLTFSGNVTINGTLSINKSIAKGSGSFVIDHPLDPANKLLYHSFVESPDAKNVYTGVVTLNEMGEATVALPDYFEALNKDFRYQFFPAGEPMPGLYIKERVHDNAFTIGGGVPGGTVSWMITGIRHDPYILVHPVRVEVEKGPTEIVDKGACIFAPACGKSI